MRTERPDWASADIDIGTPSVARVYDFLLGGSHNFAADRELARAGMAAMPDLPTYARLNRAFMHRAVRYLVGEGVRQFLDLGSGIPTVGNVHEIAQAAAPDSRVVYVDIDPVAVAHSRSILDGNPRATAVQQDVRRIDEVLAHPAVRGTLDFDAPIAVLLVAVLHYIGDEDDPHGAIAQLRDRLARGSYLVISHGSDEALDRTGAHEVQELSRRTPTGLTNRDRSAIERLFAGFDLVEPGLVWAPQWRPEDPGEVGPHPEQSGSLAGVGRKAA